MVCNAARLSNVLGSFLKLLMISRVLVAGSLFAEGQSSGIWTRAFLLWISWTLAVLVFLRHAKRWGTTYCPLTWHRQQFTVSAPWSLTSDHRVIWVWRGSSSETARESCRRRLCVDPHVEEADAGRRTWRRWARDCKIETGAKSSLYISQSASNSAEFELISKPGGHREQIVQLWIHYVRGNLQRWIRIRTRHQAFKWQTDTDPNSSTEILRDRQRAPLVQVCSLTILLYHLATSSTWRKPTHTYDGNLVAHRMTKWSESTPTQWFGD